MKSVAAWPKRTTEALLVSAKNGKLRFAVFFGPNYLTVTSCAPSHPNRGPAAAPDRKPGSGGPQEVCRTHWRELQRVVDAITHQAIAHLLGVRQEGVTEALGQMNPVGIIERSRSLAGVKNRDQLEKLSCECYGVIRYKTQRLRSPCDGG